MSAGILTRDIQTGTEMAWHGKTVVVPTIDRSNCGIIYPMRKEQLFLASGKPTEHYAIVSDDDGMAIGNPVKKNYKLISNDEMFDLIEKSLAGTSHQITSIGSIGNREKLFCSIKLSDNIIAGGRETQNVLNVLWGHGGVFGVLARSGFTVVVCANTFALALAKKGDFELRVKHTGNTEVKIENMAKAIDNHYGVTAEFKKAMDLFAAESVTEDNAKRIFAGFVVREDQPEEVATRTRNTIDRLGQLFKNGAGNHGRDLSDVFNAFTDYYSHESSGGDNNWRQFESSEFGAGHKRKTEAFRLLAGQEVADLGNLDMVIKRGDRVLQLV